MELFVKDIPLIEGFHLKKNMIMSPQTICKFWVLKICTRSTQHSDLFPWMLNEDMIRNFCKMEKESERHHDITLKVKSYHLANKPIA